MLRPPHTCRVANSDETKFRAFAKSNGDAFLQLVTKVVRRPESDDTPAFSRVANSDETKFRAFAESNGDAFLHLINYWSFNFSSPNPPKFAAICA